MFELNKDNYGLLRKLVSEVACNMLMPRSVIEQHVDGKVYVDSLEKPQTYYLVHPYGMTWLCGKSNNETFNQWLLDYFAGHSFAREKDEWLQAYPRAWDVLLKQLIDKQLATCYTRVNLKFNPDKFYENYNPIEKDQYEIISTPAEMLFELKGSVVPKDYWKTPALALEMGKAFTVLIDGKPASTAFTSARHDDQLEIGIETSLEYHGKGLAYLVCAKLIEYCLDHNLEPVWACRYENTASLNLSKKLGFTEVLRMPYYHIPKSSM